MIKNFSHKGIKRFFETGSKAGIQSAHASKLGRQLARLDRAAKPADMNLPGWKLHQLKGEVTGHWAVSVSGNWRLMFMVVDGDVFDVNYDDYH